MTTHRLTINENGEQKTCFTVAANVADAVDKVRRHFQQLEKVVLIETCAPKPNILVVESIADVSNDNVGF